MQKEWKILFQAWILKNSPIVVKLWSKLKNNNTKTAQIRGFLQELNVEDRVQISPSPPMKSLEKPSVYAGFKAFFLLK